MNYKKCKFVISFSLYVLILTAICSNVFSLEPPNTSLNTFDPAIYIDSDGDFVALGFEGSGNATHPYLIQNLNIDVSGSNNGIFISSTTKYFIIQNCTISTEYIGIRIDNVASGTAIIRNNTCVSKTNDGGGIGISGSNVWIIENNCSNFAQGIHCNMASNIHIINNSISNSSFQGINIRYTSNSELIGNRICDSKEHAIAIVKTSSSSNVVYSNIIRDLTFSDNYRIDGAEKGRQNSQGYDEGTDNVWYNETTQIGNKWLDHHPCDTGSYSIDGPANSIDLYPEAILETYCPLRRIPGYYGLGLVSLCCVIYMVGIIIYLKIK